MRKIGAEMILAVMIIPFIVWLVTSIFTLQASSGNAENDLKEIKEDVKFIREYLITK